MIELKPLLTIGIISYNRPNELKRTLDSIGLIPESVRVVVCDDASPKSTMIKEAISDYLSNAKVNFIFNDRNLGYDRNLYQVIEKTATPYVLLLGDDDYLEAGGLFNILEYLSKCDKFDCGFVRFATYLDRNIAYHRNYETSYYLSGGDALKNGSFIYNSILFSGLIFQRDSVIRHTEIFSRYFSSIYIQVAIFGLVSLKYGCHVISGPGIIAGGDGENGFGLNEASSGDDSDLANRKSIDSNLVYHERLFSVLRDLSAISGFDYFKVFRSEYRIRAVKHMLIARLINRTVYLRYLKTLFSLDKPNSLFMLMGGGIFYILPKFIVKYVLFFGEVFIYRRRKASEIFLK